LTRSFFVSAAAADGHAEGFGTAVSPLCGGAVRVPPAGGGSWRSRGTEEVAAAPRGAQGARRAVRGKGRVLVLPPGPRRAGPPGAGRPAPSAGGGRASTWPPGPPGRRPGGTNPRKHAHPGAISHVRPAGER